MKFNTTSLKYHFLHACYNLYRNDVIYVDVYVDVDVDVDVDAVVAVVVRVRWSTRVRM